MTPAFLALVEASPMQAASFSSSQNTIRELALKTSIQSLKSINVFITFSFQISLSSVSILTQSGGFHRDQWQKEETTLLGNIHAEQRRVKQPKLSLKLCLLPLR